MKNTMMAKLAALVCAAVLACGVVAGCAAAVDTMTAEQQANRAYMSQVNSVMEELGDELDSFIDAVSRDDVVNMRTQADNAYKTLDKLAELEAPEALADVHDQYVEGTGKLREALDGYVALYTEMNGSSFDYGTYEKRIADLQTLYDEGVKALEEADKTAAELE